MKYSLSTKIAIIFAIGFGVICVLFFMLLRLWDKEILDKVSHNQRNAINWLLLLQKNSNMPPDWESYFKNFNLAYVKDARLERNIMEKGETINTQNTSIGEIKTIYYNNKLFLYIKNTSVGIMLKSTLKQINDYLIISFLITIALFISLYISILKSLMPLKKLRKDIKKFASGNVDNIECANIAKSSDEIGEVAYEFNKAACKIKELIMSRQLFLRTIMHELKTPISKGRIVSEMIDDEIKKERLIAVFKRLDMLINEFAKIEQLLSKNYGLNYKFYTFSLILKRVKEILLLDNFNTKIKVNMRQDPVLRVDFELFCLAIKNLIDNGLKYSDNNEVTIICDKNYICIKNSGKPLARSIDYYKLAFIRDNKSKSPGMGLGLYICESICKMHNFKFLYKYKDGYHEFYIIFKAKNERF